MYAALSWTSNLEWLVRLTLKCFAKFTIKSLLEHLTGNTIILK